MKNHYAIFDTNGGLCHGLGHTENKAWDDYEKATRQTDRSEVECKPISARLYAELKDGLLPGIHFDDDGIGQIISAI